MKRKNILKKAPKIDLNISDKTEIQKMVDGYNQQRNEVKVPLKINDKLVIMVNPENCTESFRKKYIKQRYGK